MFWERCHPPRAAASRGAGRGCSLAGLCLLQNRSAAFGEEPPRGFAPPRSGIRAERCTSSRCNSATSPEWRAGGKASHCPGRQQHHGKSRLHGRERRDGASDVQCRKAGRCFLSSQCCVCLARTRQHRQAFEPAAACGITQSQQSKAPAGHSVPPALGGFHRTVTPRCSAVPFICHPVNSWYDKKLPSKLQKYH